MSYSQNDPHWAGQVLGFGPAQYTIGSNGCYLSSDAQVLYWAGHEINPGQLNDLYKANGIFVQGDMLMDSALHDAFPNLFALEDVYHCEAIPCDINQLDNSVLYVVVEIAGPNGLTHFSPVTDWRNWKIADAWDGVERTIGERGALWGWGSDSATLVGKVMKYRYVGGGGIAATNILMYDSTTASDIPVDAPAVGGYINGTYKWSQADWDRFPTQIKVRIAVNAQTNDGEVLDCETGDATPDECPGWIRMRQAAGLGKPTIYCNANTVPAVQQACSGLNYCLWVADYGRPGTASYGKPHAIEGASAVQYADPAAGTGGHYDLSIIHDAGWPYASGSSGGGSIGGEDMANSDEILSRITDVQNQLIYGADESGIHTRIGLIADIFNLVKFEIEPILNQVKAAVAAPATAPPATAVTVDAAAVAAALAANADFLAAIAKAVNDDLARRASS